MKHKLDDLLNATKILLFLIEQPILLKRNYICIENTFNI